MADIINFPGDATYLDLDPREMVEHAMEAYDFDQVMLIGQLSRDNDKDGIIVCSSTSDSAEMVFFLEMAKKNILDASEY